MLALGMKAVWYDIFDNPPPDAPAAPRRALDDLLREADFVSIHMDLNDSSRHLIGAREIALMRREAYLVNTARGGVVDQAALTAALQDNRIAGAGLDVLAPEPPDPDDPDPGFAQRGDLPAHGHRHPRNPQGDARPGGGQCDRGPGRPAATGNRQPGSAGRRRDVGRSTPPVGGPGV